MPGSIQPQPDPALRRKGLSGQALPQELDMEMARAEVERFSSVFGSVDRILNPGVVSVKVDHVPNHPAPAWTDGGVIFLNTAVLPDLKDGTPADLAMWLGMNAHELGHTLYTPRRDSYLHRMVQKGKALYAGLDRVEYLVEDQRQERLLVAQFQPLATYLTAAVTGMMARTPAQGMGDIWPYIAGRTWLPAQLRAAVRRAYKGKHARKIAKLVGEYQRLADPGTRDAEQAYKILVRIHELFLDDDFEVPEIPNGCGQANPTHGEETPAYTDDEDQPSGGSDEDEAALDEADAEAEADEQARKGKGRGQPRKGKGQGKGEPDRNSIKPETKSDPDEGESKGQGEGQAKEAGGGEQGEGGGYDPDSGIGEGSDSQDSGGRGAGSAYKIDNLPRTTSGLTQALRDMVENTVESDTEVAEDLKQMAKALQVMPESNVKLPRISAQYSPPSPELQALAKDMSNHFRQFTDRALPYWDRRTETGRFNVGRYLNSDGYDYDTMFDRFEPGMQDDLSLDVTVLMDRSGSMQGGWSQSSRSPMQEACRAGWAIHKAVEVADGTTTVIFYDDNSQVLVQPGEKVTKDVPYVNPGGNTDPTTGLVAVYRRLQGVDARHKLVIGVTDGGWSRGVDSLKEIGMLPNTTTVTVILAPGIANNPSTMDSHMRAAINLGGHVTKVLDSPLGLVGLVEELVTHRMARVLDGYDGA